MQGQNEEMLLAACEQFLGKAEQEIRRVALETLGNTLLSSVIVERLLIQFIIKKKNWMTI